MYGLTDNFMVSLKEGKFRNLLEVVQKDDSLCMTIGDNCIRLYYRGGSLLKEITENDLNSDAINFKRKFDQNYFEHQEINGFFKDNIREDLEKTKTIDEFIRLIPRLKREMDLKGTKAEREFEQLIFRENNYSGISNDTDYFMVDMEALDCGNGSQFDLIAIKWPSESTAKIACKPITLAIIEMKYGDKALKGDAGIVKHFKDIENYAKEEKINVMIKKAETQFNQLVELGLINVNIGIVNGEKKKIVVDQIKPEFIIVAANHKPIDIKLKNELKSAIEKYPDILKYVDVKIATSSLMGYGLYQKQMIDINKYLSDEID
ncbi:hypothetical protein [uncultured Acetobacterium sp.]|uniref:hypothetical protein n=1 Tax=uncultured Acetobacterium sp. TaxID=217139 RepID=UPI0025E6F88C|nr:hypothetical protein [uncultured Acetobacterium sp.]